MILLTLAIVAAALLAGPTPFLVRAALRHAVGRSAMRRWQAAATLGLGAGILGAIGLGSVMGLAVTVGVIALLALLAGMDLAWRWLPHEWTAALGALGVLSAWSSDTVATAVLGAIIGGGTLFALQLGHRVLRGGEGLGTGDVILGAVLGLLVGGFDMPWLLCLAAVTGLVHAGLTRLRAHPAAIRRYEVAFGAHLALASLIFLT